MDKTNTDVEYAGQLLHNLNEMEMSLVDFDEMKTWIAEQMKRAERLEVLEGELQTLKDDYTGRIAGMLRAIAVTDRGRPGREASLQLIDSLPSMPIPELVDCFNMISARFRDVFPPNLLRPRRRAGRPGDLSVYK